MRSDMAIGDVLAEAGSAHAVWWSDRASGLRAVLVIDDVTLGPGAGGIRTRRYAGEEDALREAASLARAMTTKCALAGLAAGGAKCVVIDHEGLDRARAFAVLGRRIEELGGLFRTAGDLGTSAADLERVASETRFVHTDERGLADAVARGLLRCIEACVAVHERRATGTIVGLEVAVQGAGAIGAAVAHALAVAGARVRVADVDPLRARAVAEATGARVVDAATVLEEDADVIAPCAIGRVLDRAAAERLRAWAVCGAANDILADDSVADLLAARGILHVPDPIASAGAVIEGIGRTVMSLPDRTPLIDRLGATAHEVLLEAARTNRPPLAIARSRARSRLAVGSTP